MQPQPSLPEQMLRAQTQKSINRSPWLFALMGILLMILGVVAIVAAFITTMATVLLFGALLVLAGIAQFLEAFAWYDLGEFSLHLAFGILYAALGGLLVYDPLAGALGLTLVLGGFFLIAGIARLGIAFKASGSRRGWLVVLGVLNLVLAGLIFAGWPQIGTWIIGLFVGLELFLCGLAFVMFAAASHGQPPQSERAEELESFLSRRGQSPTA